jgi:hypothetical protein
MSWAIGVTAVRDHHREALETVRQERERLRETAESARMASEEARMAAEAARTAAERVARTDAGRGGHAEDTARDQAVHKLDSD